MGPVMRCALTAVLVIPTLLLINTLRFAGASVEYAFAIVPLAGFIMLDVRLLPEIWERGRPTTRRRT